MVQPRLAFFSTSLMCMFKTTSLYRARAERRANLSSKTHIYHIQMTSLEEKTAVVEISPGPLQGINSTDSGMPVPHQLISSSEHGSLSETQVTLRKGSLQISYTRGICVSSEPDRSDCYRHKCHRIT